MHPAVANSLFVRRRSPVAGFVVVSVAAHVVVVAAAVLVGMLNRPPPLVLDQKPIKASLVRLGKERDKKLLPRKEEAPPPPKEVVKAPPPTPEPPAPVKPAEAVPIPGVKPPEPAPAKQAGTKTGEAPKRSLFDAFSKAAAKPDEELEGASDGDPLGDSAIQEGERYYGALLSQIRRYYDVSSTIGEQERMHLRAQVLFRIGRGGELLDVKLAKQSGNDLFDSAVVSAAKKAAPFAPPPDHLRPALSGEGILLEFRP